MKNLLKLGSTLTRVEQKQIFGGVIRPELPDLGCDDPMNFECQSSDDCGWQRDPLTGNMMNGICQSSNCGSYCRYVLH